MSGVNVWGCIGNLAHTQHLTDRGGVIEVFHRIILDDLKGYTVTGVTHGHGRTGGSSGEKRPFCDILSQLKPTLMHSSALEPPCDARSDELDQKIPAVRRPSKKPLE